VLIWSKRLSHLCQNPRNPCNPADRSDGKPPFYFVTGGIHEALDRARDAANGMDVRMLGGGERLFEGVDLRALS
jgi:hypothetical protein